MRESNLQAQLFFKKMGFKAVLVIRSHYDDTEEDAYVMRFSVRAKEAENPWILPATDERSAFAPVNRISEYDAA